MADLADRFERKLKFAQTFDSTEKGVHFGILFDSDDAKKAKFDSAWNAFVKAVSSPNGSAGLSPVEGDEKSGYTVSDVYFDISVDATPDSGKIVPNCNVTVTGTPTVKGKALTEQSIKAIVLNAVRGAYKIAMGMSPEDRAAALNKAKKFPLNANKVSPELKWGGFGF